MNFDVNSLNLENMNEVSQTIGNETFNEIFDSLISLGMKFFLILGIIVLFNTICTWIVFKKCGRHGIASIIPIWNAWEYLECGDMPGWLCLIPVANVIGAIVASFKIPKKFGKSGAFGLGLLFLSPIFILILACSKPISADEKPVETFDDNQNTTPNNNESNETIESLENLNVNNSDSEINFVAEENNKTVDNLNNNASEIPFEMKETSITNNIEENILDQNVTNNDSFNNNTIFDNREPLSVEPIKKEETIEQFDLGNNILETSVTNPEKDPDVLEETIELPKMANVAINESITEKKKCPGCGFDNEYSAHTCTMCGHSLD